MRSRDCVAVFVLICFSLSAQVPFDPEASVNPNSMYNIPVYEQVYKVRVWRDFDLKEKQNQGFFARGNEISRVILDAIRSGEIDKVYKNDSLTSSYTKEEFLGSLEMVPKAQYNPWNSSQTYLQGDNVTYNGADYVAIGNPVNPGVIPGDPNSQFDWQVTTAGQALSFMAQDIYNLRLVEDIIFDKRRSRLYYDIQGILLQAWDVNGGAFRPLGWVKYKDMERVFRAHPEKSVWFNRQNTAQNRNFADAFLLRLFHASIYMVENPNAQALSEIYPNYNESVMARDWEEMKLMEKEHNLWEY